MSTLSQSQFLLGQFHHSFVKKLAYSYFIIETHYFIPQHSYLQRTYFALRYGIFIRLKLLQAITLISQMEVVIIKALI